MLSTPFPGDPKCKQFYLGKGILIWALVMGVDYSPAAARSRREDVGGLRATRPLQSTAQP